jgi:hypothetical protein
LADQTSHGLDRLGSPELGDGSAIVRQLTRRDTARVVFAE